jgi:hypothetical protein
VSLFYFYNHSDANARKAKELLIVAARQNRQSRGRAADAHAVLAPALEGFSPTPKFPEIEQAQTLLAALVETDEVRNAATARHVPNLRSNGNI